MSNRMRITNRYLVKEVKFIQNNFLANVKIEIVS